jgi:chemotaxis protein methyltransferase CheR
MSNKDEVISNSDFTRLRNLIEQESGINLKPDKKLMVELRIKPRLKTLCLGSYAEYCEYLFGRQGLKDELIHLIDVVTTNKTDFFREPGHFDYLVQKALPEVAARNGQKEVLIWSAGCSTGEEPYTLAIVLSEYAAAHPGFRFKLLATDIALSVLEKASLGIFTEDVVSPVPAALQRKYFMRSRDKESRQLRSFLSYAVPSSSSSLISWMRIMVWKRKWMPSSAATSSSTSIAPRRSGSCRN